MPLSGSAGLYRAKVRARGRDLASKGLSRALLFHLAEQVTVWRYHSSFIYSVPWCLGAIRENYGLLISHGSKSEAWIKNASGQKVGCLLPN